MEEIIIKYLSVGGTPITIVLGGYLLYRWTSTNFVLFKDDLKEIKQALNCKVSKELYNSERSDMERRVERLENIKNGQLKC